MQVEQSVPRRRSRFWLYAPYGLLALLAVAWSIGWVVIRARVTDGLETWLADEKAAGRTWTCPDRQVGGYPFRIEIVCPTLTVASPDTNASLGRLLVVTQIYSPSHIIAEASGPLRLSSGGTELEAAWSLLQTSVHLSGGKPQRGDLVAEKPVIKATLPGQGTLPLSADQLEIHLRPDPTNATAADVALSSVAARLPGVAAVTGSADPVGIDFRALVTQVRDLPRRSGVPDVERWRLAEGRVEIARLALGQGARRIEARGTLALDELHRPQGQLDLAGKGVDEIVSRFVGGRAASLVGTLGALFGAPPPPAATPGTPGLQSLPSVRLAGGKLQVGPLVTGIRLPPLY